MLDSQRNDACNVEIVLFKYIHKTLFHFNLPSTADRKHVTFIFDMHIHTIRLIFNRLYNRLNRQFQFKGSSTYWLALMAAFQVMTNGTIESLEAYYEYFCHKEAEIVNCVRIMTANGLFNNYISMYAFRFNMMCNAAKSCLHQCCQLPVELLCMYDCGYRLAKRC